MWTYRRIPPAPYILESLKLHVKTSPCWASIVGSQCDVTHICCLSLAPVKQHLQHVYGYPSISPARMVLSSKPADSHCCCWSTGWTDSWPVRRPCSTYYVGSISNLMIQKTLEVSMTSQLLDAIYPTCWFRLCHVLWETDIWQKHVMRNTLMWPQSGRHHSGWGGQA